MPGIRVIAGKAKGRKLKMVPGIGTRPIVDRVKQALFNILGSDIVDASFLDLFAGTGSVGIEALSRGAAFALLLDLDRKAIQTIHENIAHCGFTESSEVLQRDVFAFLKSSPLRSFDMIFIAPPQYLELWSKTLKLLDQQHAWINPDGIVIVQIDPSEYVPQELQMLSLYDQRKYGNTLLLFYEKPGE
ncbi:MAG: 16S rRNA (guanine(966)-N(2))-methyltransferase RsmD [Anaerolineales bacterium]|nr:MAG: 16S rRNA (guanine(966)-N(2))-methyltransferase RsmD [Anaerolineales bacterium]